MSESERYIVSWLNTQSNNISFYVQRYLKVDTPKNEKDFCVNKIAIFCSDFIKLSQKIKIDNIGINDFFNHLYLLRDANISAIDRILSLFGYKEKVEYTYESIVNRIANNLPLSRENIRFMEFYLINDLVKEEDKEIVYEYFIKCVLLKVSGISYDAFESLMKSYTFMQMKRFIDDPYVEVKSDKELNGKLGYSYQNTQYLNRDELILMHSTGCYRPLKTIFHETMHNKQYKDTYLSNGVDDRMLTMIKDDILSEVLKDYYNENYASLYSEAEAEIFSINEIDNLFNRFEIRFKNGKSPYDEALPKLNESLNNKNRVYEGKDVSLDELFENVLSSYPVYLEKVPILKEYYYIGNNGKVEKKNIPGRY